MRGNDFDKFNNTRARMLDYIYYVTLKLLKNRIFGVKTSGVFLPYLGNVIMEVIMLRYSSV